jgi:hypothetical protein
MCGRRSRKASRSISRSVARVHLGGGAPSDCKNAVVPPPNLLGSQSLLQGGDFMPSLNLFALQQDIPIAAARYPDCLCDAVRQHKFLKTYANRGHGGIWTHDLLIP